MKRNLWALAALLFGLTGMCHADYVLIRVNLGIVPPPEDPNVKVVGQPFLPPAIGGRPGFAPPPVAVAPPAPGDLANRLSVVVLVTYTKYHPPVMDYDKTTGKPYVKQVFIDHRWGKVNEIVIEPPGKANKGVETVWFQKRPSPFARFDVMQKELQTAKDKSASRYLDLADFALTNGLVNKVPDVLAELRKLDLTADKDGAKAKSVLDAFDQVTKDLQKVPSQDDMPLPWKVGPLKSESSEHYTLYYDAVAAGLDIKQRLTRLEDNLKAFYYWFALRGKALPVPERRQVAALLDRPMEFSQIRMTFGAPAIVNDGCYAPRHNVVAFSAVPLDDGYDVISRQFKDLTQNGWQFGNLLKGVRPVGKVPEEIALAQTMALVSKALHEESEIAGVSHLGTRQLMTAAGLTPRTVVLPRWLQFGFPAVFETPKFSRETQTGAFWPTFGAPSWVYQVQWKDWEREKLLDPPDEAIYNVIGDGYFRASQNPAALFKAKTMAWSFAYYLSERHLDSLLRYCQELGQLPRDLDLDDDVYLGCFARAFQMVDPTAPRGINEAKLSALAKDWYSVIGITPPPQYPEMLLDAQKMRELMYKKPAGKP